MQRELIAGAIISLIGLVFVGLQVMRTVLNTRWTAMRGTADAQYAASRTYQYLHRPRHRWARDELTVAERMFSLELQALTDARWRQSRHQWDRQRTEAAA